MKKKMRRFNDETIDLTEFENIQLTEIERKATKKRIKSKLQARKRKDNSKKIVVGIASLILGTYIGFNSKDVLAKIPIIGGVIEQRVLVNEGSLNDYKTLIGETVKDNGIQVTLNEVMIDEGQLLISSTFQNDFSVEDMAYNWYTNVEVYVNGEEMNEGGSGGPVNITNSYVNYFWAANLEEHLKLEEDETVKIVFNNLERSDSKKIEEGKWSFEFTASADNLIIEKETIPINKDLVLMDGQKILVEELILTPISTKLNYQMENMTKEIYFKIEDQHGKQLQELSSEINGNNNSNRYIALNKEITKLKIIPYHYSDDTSGNQTFLSDEAFEVKVK